MKLKIIHDNNPIMRKKSEPVSLPLTSEEKNILDEMLDYLIVSQDPDYAAKHKIRAGVGLAAIQVGILKRMFVVYIKDEDGKETKYQLVNPRIIETSVRKIALEQGEGCLSVKEDHPGLVHRHYKIKMKAYNALTNKEEEIVARGFPAIVLQHEYDHLDGIFYYDRIDKKQPNTPLDNEEIL